MFASLTVLALFIALAWLERSFLNHIMAAARESPTHTWPHSPSAPGPDSAVSDPLPQDS